MRRAACGCGLGWATSAERFYAAPVALVVYALFGRSRFLIVGATSAAAVLSAATVSDVSPDTASAVSPGSAS